MDVLLYSTVFTARRKPTHSLRNARAYVDSVVYDHVFACLSHTGMVSNQLNQSSIIKYRL